jgi:DNA-binding transcriptional LysR family regulator
MQVESFKVFRDLVESRSFSKAASLNFITQSAVSQQVRAMEERFRVPLIERSNKRFGLTREGQLLYESSKLIIFQFDSLQHQLSEMRNIVSGTIRLSTVYSIGLHELPPYLKRFLREFPSVNVHVEYRRSNQVYEEVIEGTSDLGLVAFPVQKKTLKIEPFRKDRLVLICVPSLTSLRARRSIRFSARPASK